jgi:hypothetical protein
MNTAKINVFRWYLQVLQIIAVTECPGLQSDSKSKSAQKWLAEGLFLQSYSIQLE